MSEPSAAAAIARTHNPSLGVALIMLAMTAISINDVLIKQMSGDYPLHQLIFIRSLIGVVFSLALVQAEGGITILRTRTPGLHALRGGLIVVANLAYFTALAAVPLASATALFFIAPLVITVMAGPLLGERIGLLRLSAAAVGFAGVVVMLRPWADAAGREAPLAVMALPVIGAVAYASSQILTRRLGVSAKASAMAVYIQAMFIGVCGLVYLAAGRGGFAAGLSDPSLLFLLRPWIWPAAADLWLLAFMGFNAGVIGYTLSQAYRQADAATVAPFEYVGLPMAVLWGWWIWDETPGSAATTGIMLIMGAGLFVFLRERVRGRPVAGAARINRRY